MWRTSKSILCGLLLLGMFGSFFTVGCGEQTKEPAVEYGDTSKGDGQTAWVDRLKDWYLNYWTSASSPPGTSEITREELPPRAAISYDENEKEWGPDYLPVAYRTTFEGQVVFIIEEVYDVGGFIELYNEKGDLLAAGSSGESTPFEWSDSTSDVVVPLTFNEIKNLAQNSVRDALLFSDEGTFCALKDYQFEGYSTETDDDGQLTLISGISIAKGPVDHCAGYGTYQCITEITPLDGKWTLPHVESDCINIGD